MSLAFFFILLSSILWSFCSSEEGFLPFLWVRIIIPVTLCCFSHRLFASCCSLNHCYFVCYLSVVWEIEWTQCGEKIGKVHLTVCYSEQSPNNKSEIKQTETCVRWEWRKDGACTCRSWAGFVTACRWAARSSSPASRPPPPACPGSGSWWSGCGNQCHWSPVHRVVTQ